MGTGIKIETTGEWHTHTHTHTPKPVCDPESATVLWNPGVHTYRECTTNRQDIIINKPGNVQVNVTLRRFRVSIVAV